MAILIVPALAANLIGWETLQPNITSNNTVSIADRKQGMMALSLLLSVWGNYCSTLLGFNFKCSPMWNPVEAYSPIKITACILRTISFTVKTSVTIVSSIQHVKTINREFGDLDTFGSGLQEFVDQAKLNKFKASYKTVENSTEKYTAELDVEFPKAAGNFNATFLSTYNKRNKKVTLTSEFSKYPYTANFKLDFKIDDLIFTEKDYKGMFDCLSTEVDQKSNHRKIFPQFRCFKNLPYHLRVSKTSAKQ